MIAVGDAAPDFEAPDQDGKPFRLSSLRGKPVVLFFYPEADTSGCTIEAKGFQSELPGYRAKGVAVVGVSVDNCDKQKAFANKYGLAYPLVADAKKEVAQRYGVLGPAGRARRVSFFIGPTGTVEQVVDGKPPEHLEKARSRFLAA